MYKSLRAQTLHYFARPHEGVPAAPVASPAAWRGDDMQRRPGDWTLALTPAETGELDAAQQHAAATRKPMGALTAADFPLPTLAPRIAEWRHTLHHGRG